MDEYSTNATMSNESTNYLSVILGGTLLNMQGRKKNLGQSNY